MKPYEFLIVYVGVTASLGLLLWTARRGRPKVDLSTGALWFRHSVLFRGFAVLAAFGMPLAITALLIFVMPPKNAGDVLAVIAIYALFFVLGGPLLWEASRFALGVSKAGLDCRSPWRASRFVPWTEVTQISYSSINSWFIIRTRDGWKFHVSVLVPGLSEFLASCE
jgi:hypothetical protein